eukprot:10003186-Karenia_brevis.AAC.1
MTRAEYESIQRGGGWPDTDSEFQRAAGHVMQALHYGSPAMLTPQSIDKVCEVISERVLMATGATVDASSLRDHIAPLCQLLEPTEFLAMTLT